MTTGPQRSQRAEATQHPARPSQGSLGSAEDLGPGNFLPCDPGESEGRSAKECWDRADSANCPESQGRDPGLLNTVRAGWRPRDQAEPPHHTCLPPLFPGQKEKFQSPQQQPQRCWSHSVSQTTRVTCRSGQSSPACQATVDKFFLMDVDPNNPPRGLSELPVPGESTHRP